MVVAAVLALVVTAEVIQFYAGEEVELRQRVAAPPQTAAPPVSAPPAAESSVAESGFTAIPPPAPIPGSPAVRLQLFRPGSGIIADFPLGAPMQTNADGEINPDGLEIARWVNDSDMAAPGSDAERTVYIAGHTHPSKAAVFNPLYDRATSTSHVQIGDEFHITTEQTIAMGADPLRYVVEGVEDYPKGVVAEGTENEVWQIVPGRLVIITCFQNPSGTRSTDNFAVYAQLQD